MKIAVIGSGISGLSSAWLLKDKHDVDLFEKNNYLGGHSNTATINIDNKEQNVDTGFIVFNHKTYPNLKEFFKLLNVKIEKSNMSFGIKDIDNFFEYSGNNLAGIFAQRKNLFNYKFLIMLKDILKFNKISIDLIENNKIDNSITLEEFVGQAKLGQFFRDYYLFPMAGAIWSCPLQLIKNYPAKTFIQFFYNHGLLTVTKQPQWYSISGGSKEYVKKISNDLNNQAKLNCNIIKSYQDKNKIILIDSENNSYKYDHVIFASHANETRKIISDKTKEEDDILSKFKYSKNVAYLHSDTDQMPQNKKAWASWVYLSSKSKNKVSLTYWMNNLQNIDNDTQIFVTLNPIDKINLNKIYGKYEYQHPIFDYKAISAQKKLINIQGKRNIWFAGAWTKYGFHEDGLNSAINVAKSFDIKIPWQK